MEASEAFSQGVEIGEEEDPFAGSDFGDFEQPSEEGKPAAASEPTEEEPLPVVDREGERVAPPAAQESQEAAEEVTAAEEEVTTEPEGAPLAADPTPPAESDGPTEDPTSATSGEPTEAGATGATPAGDEVAADPTPASSAPPPAAPVAAASAEPASGGKNKTTLREYVVLKVEGPGKFAQVTWHVNKQGKMVKKGTEGAKEQGVAKVRGTDEALKIGYAALGSPENGVKLIAVAALYFQVRNVSPRPPEPEKQRLVIS